MLLTSALHRSRNGNIPLHSRVPGIGINFF